MNKEDRDFLNSYNAMNKKEKDSSSNYKKNEQESLRTDTANLKLYEKAVSDFEKAKTIEDYEKNMSDFSLLGDFKDSALYRGRIKVKIKDLKITQKPLEPHPYVPPYIPQKKESVIKDALIGVVVAGPIGSVVGAIFAADKNNKTK